MLQPFRAQNDAKDAALYEVTQMHYSDLEENIGRYLQQKYAASATVPKTE